MIVFSMSVKDRNKRFYKFNINEYDKKNSGNHPLFMYDIKSIGADNSVYDIEI